MLGFVIDQIDRTCFKIGFDTPTYHSDRFYLESKLQRIHSPLDLKLQYDRHSEG